MKCLDKFYPYTIISVMIFILSRYQVFLTLFMFLDIPKPECSGKCIPTIKKGKALFIGLALRKTYTW